MEQRCEDLRDALLAANAGREWGSGRSLQPEHLFRSDGALRSTPGEIARAIERGTNWRLGTLGESLRARTTRRRRRQSLTYEALPSRPPRATAKAKTAKAKTTTATGRALTAKATVP